MRNTSLWLATWSCFFAASSGMDWNGVRMPGDRVPDVAEGCEGCSASGFHDPAQNVHDGIEVISTSPGLTIQASVGWTHGSCAGIEAECVPDQNCRFQANYTVYDDGTNGPFRDDQPNWPFAGCHFSKREVGGGDPGDDNYLTSLRESSAPWLAACNSLTWTTVRFFNNCFDESLQMPVCYLGSLIAEVKFHGSCAKCPASPQ